MSELSKKALLMIRRTYATGRPLATVDDAVIRELTKSKLMRTSGAFLELTEAGNAYAEWLEEGR